MSKVFTGMRKYRIGNLGLKNQILLAPMLEPNDVAFRLLCKKAGCGLTWTGMTSALSKKKLDLDDRPALQLFGNSVRGIVSFMKKYDSEVSLWDFNLGCPSKLSRKLEHGAFMISRLKGIEKILRVMRENTDKPLTIKIRKSENTLDVVRMAERVGVDAVCIHARTAGQGYSGEVDYDFALEVKRVLKIPIIFSGDVGEDNVGRILKDFDFVMVGRSCIGRPGFFSKFSGSDPNVEFWEYLKLAKKYKLFFRQIKYQAMNFTKGVAGGKKSREALVETKSVGDIERIMGRNK